MGATQEVREIRVVVDTKGIPGIKELASNFKAMNQSVKDGTAVLKTFRNAFLAIQGFSFAGIGLGELVSTIDGVQKLSDRLALSEGSIEGARTALGKLNEVANVTNTGIEDIAIVYNRLNLSLRETGISTNALLGVTLALQNSFRLSGATVSEATAATIQLSQGMASGQLRGQELRSVLESNAEIGGILAKQLGLTRGELLKFAEKSGGIKAQDFLITLANNFDSINERAAKLKPTISEGIAVAFNDLKVGLGDLNKEFGITEKVVAGIFAVSKNIKEIAISVTALGSAWFFYAKGASIAAFATGAVSAAIGASYILLMVKAAAVTAAVGAGLISLPLAITGVVTAFVLAFSTVEDFRNALLDLGKTLYLGIFTKEYRDKLIAEEEQIKRNKQATIDLKNSNQALIYELPDVIKGFGQTLEVMKTGAYATSSYGVALKGFASDYKNSQKEVITFKQSLATLNGEYLKTGNVAKYNSELKKLKISELKEQFEQGAVDLEEYNKRLKEINFGKPRKSLDEFRLDLSKLNASLSSGKMTLGQYADALEAANLGKLNRDMETGRANAIDTLESLNTHKINEWRRALYEGNVTINQFRVGTQAEGLDLLNKKFEAGKIDVYEFNREVVALSDKFHPGSSLFTGIADYISQAGTLSQNVAGAISNTFQNLEKSMLDFIKTGKFNFEDFTKSILDDLNKIIVRSLIIRPLAQGLLSFIPTGAEAGVAPTSSNLGSVYSSQEIASMAAKGAAFDGMSANFFADGGVVKGRTGFTYGGGKKGILGEAGPEAILPLARNKNGDLGVASAGGSSNVIVNVINNGDNNVEQTERQGPGGERILDVIITQKVKEGFASGLFDKQMSQNYGIRRRGI